MVDSLPDQPPNGPPADPAAGSGATGPDSVDVAARAGTIVDTTVLVANDGAGDLVDGRPLVHRAGDVRRPEATGSVVTFRTPILTLLPARMDLELGVSVAVPAAPRTVTSLDTSW